MKVLFFAPYIYDVNHKDFGISSSGFGYMVNDILQEISKNNETFLVTHKFTKGYIDSYKAIKHTKKDVVKCLRLIDIFRSFKQLLVNHDSLKNKMRYMYYYMNAGFIRQTIKSIKPDIVHIHGLTMQTKPIIELCEQIGSNYLVTMHGLNGNNCVVNASNENKKYEKNGLIFLEEHKRIVTTVSTGTRKHIVDDYGLSGKNIRIVVNGIKLPEMTDRNNRNTKKYVLCVGSISHRKNQLQLVRVCSLLTDEEKKQIEIHIVGAPSPDIDINVEINKLGLQNVITFHGFVPRENISDMWRHADLNVVMSKSEGFGLSIIEGFSFGVPCIAFNDIDAIPDVYDDVSMELIKSKNDEDVLQTMRSALCRDWNRKKIIDFSKKFSLFQIGQQYMNVYRDVLGASGSVSYLK